MMTFLSVDKNNDNNANIQAFRFIHKRWYVNNKRTRHKNCAVSQENNSRRGSQIF